MICYCIKRYELQNDNILVWYVIVLSNKLILNAFIWLVGLSNNQIQTNKFE